MFFVSETGSENKNSMRCGIFPWEYLQTGEGQMCQGSVSVTDGPWEAFSLPWCCSQWLLEERLCFAEGLVGLTSHLRGKWYSRQRESKQKYKMQISMARCVIEGSSAKFEWRMKNLESKVYVFRGSITSNYYYLNSFMCEFFLEIVSFIWLYPCLKFLCILYCSG